MLNYLIKIIDRAREEDKKLLKRFLDDLPPSGCIDYIKNLGGKSWDKSKLSSHLDTVYHEWNNVGYEFLDKKIEEKKKSFFQNTKEYTNYVSINTFVVEHDINSVGLAEEWRESNPEKYEEACFNIPEKGRKLGEDYDEFVRFAKKKLLKSKLSWIVYSILILLLPLLGSIITLLLQKLVF